MSWRFKLRVILGVVAAEFVGGLVFGFAGWNMYIGMAIAGGLYTNAVVLRLVLQERRGPDA